jgi:hypothetical protein
MDDKFSHRQMCTTASTVRCSILLSATPFIVFS